jgi:hypothetical protein
MATRRETARDRLSLERLEPRALLAGDVTASVVNGTLRLTGDDDANEISISGALNGSGDPVANSFVVTGLSGTTINGMSGSGGGNASITFGGITGLNVDLGDGDDIVQLTNAQIQRNVNIATGAGADQVWIGAFNGQPSGTTGTGSAITGNLGDEFNALTPATLSVDAGQVRVRGNLSISTGDDDDQVAESNLLVDGDHTIRTGEGADRVLMMALSDVVDTTNAIGDTADQVDTGVNVRGRLVVNLGSGTSDAASTAVDEVFAQSVTARKGVYINGPDDAQFSVSDVHGGNAGLVLNGRVPGNSNGNNGQNGDDEDEDDDGQNGNSSVNAAIQRLQRMLDQYQQMITQLIQQMNRSANASAFSGLGASLNGMGRGNSWHRFDRF